MNWSKEQRDAVIKRLDAPEVQEDLAKRRAKYGSKRTIFNGITFASAKEAKRYQELLLIEKAGWLKDLTLQPWFILQEAFRDRDGKAHRAIWYVADFQYQNCGTGVSPCEPITVEDCKGYRTDIYRLKKKLFLKRYQDLIFIES